MRFANLGSVLAYQARRLGSLPALRHRRFGWYQDLSWERYGEEVRFAALGLIDLGIGPGDRVGLVGENSPGWLQADMAILTAGAVCITPHANLTARQILFQLQDSEAVWVVVSNAGQREKIESCRDQLPHLRGVTVLENSAGGENASTWDALCQRGMRASARIQEELQRRDQATGPDSLATIMYTSGTTGNPKGVMLTHGNILSNTQAILEVQPHEQDDLILSWLPYTHIYARTCDHYKALMAGVTMALAESAETVVANLRETRPTHLAAVPRFYEKVLSALPAVDLEKRNQVLRSLFGPRIGMLSSGGAALPVEIAEIFRDAGLRLMAGYGLTESSPVISFNSLLENKIGSVGKPLPGVEVKIADDGEILTRGPHVMKGYWKNPEATADSIRDGWLHTGDLGTVDEDGFLSITGRKKELMVLSTGKKVIPSYLEGLLIADPCVDQVIVCGEGRNFLTALVVPHWDNLRAALQESGEAHQGSPAQLARQPEVNAFFCRRLRERLADLSSGEQIKKIVILDRPFSVEAEEMTVSLKLRRNVILEHFHEAIDDLYREFG